MHTYTGFFLGSFLRGTESIVMQISFVMLIFSIVLGLCWEKVVIVLQWGGKSLGLGGLLLKKAKLIVELLKNNF